MKHEEFLQVIKNSCYSKENYCVYKFTFGDHGEYIGKTEKYTLYQRYNLVRKPYSSKRIKQAVESCSTNQFSISILHRETDVNKLRDKEIELISQLDPTLKLNTHKGGIITDDKIPRKFQNLITGEIVEKACCDMVRQYGGSVSNYSHVVNNRRDIVKVWCLPENYERLKIEGVRNNKRHSFKRLYDGLEEYLSATEMSKKYGGRSTCYSRIVYNNDNITSKGWCLTENYEKLISEGRSEGENCFKKFKFKRLSDGLEEYLSISEMAKKHKGSCSNYCSLTKGSRNTANGWCLADNYNSLKLIGSNGSRHKKHRFKRLFDGFEEYLSCTEMSNKYGKSKSYYFSRLYNKTKPFEDWICIC